MAYTKPTLAELKQGLADRHDSGVLPTESATLAEWIRLFNRAAAYCISRLRIVKSASVTIASGTGALPDDFIFIDKVLDSSENEMTQISLKDSDAAVSGDLVFWVSGDFATGFYLNAPDDDTLKIYYIYRPAPMSVDADTCPFPDEEAIVAYAYGMLRRSESDPFEDAGKALMECDDRLKEISSQYNQNDEALGFKLYTNA